MKFTGMSRTIRCLIAMMAVCLVMLCGAAVAENASDFTISNGVLMKYNGSDQVVTVPDGVTSIGANAFSYSYSLSKITLPDTVTSIGDSAFGNCYSLPSIILPDGITSIGQEVFYDRITVYCNENTTTEQTLSEAGYSYQIYQPIALTYADNGDGTATITGLTGVGDELIIPSTVDGLKVTTIGKSAFRYNTELTSVVIPEGVTKIESGAFNGCRLIQSMTLPSTLVTIEGSAFMNCYQIAELKIPAATTDIYAGAFRGSPIPLVIDSANTAYTVVDGVLYTADRKILKFCPDSKTGVFAIPEGTEEVESGAFFACNSVTELHIPASVTTIPAYSFYPMGALNDFVVDEASESYQAVDGMLLTKDGKILIVGCDAQNGKVTIPDGVEEIWPQALVSSRITELVLPEGIITINTRAIDAYRLEKVNLPGSLISIDTDAFSSKRSTLVATVEDGSYAHQWCIDNDVTVEVVSKVTDPAFFTYTNNGDGTCTITGYSGTVADVIIPGIINGLQVTAIDEAFEENTVLTSVVIPEGVTRIGWDAFLDCSNLKSVTLPSTLVTVEGYVFGCCSSLTELAIPAATTDIHERAIYGAPTVITVDEANPAYVVVEGMLYTADRKTLKFCPTTKAGVLTIPEGTETIETMVFENCHNLTEIRIPASVSSISNGRMNLLKSFVIAETNTTYQAVDGMLLSKDGKSLVAVSLARFADTGVITVPDGVQRIIRSAIRGALEEIKELVLPEGITTLDTGAVDARYLEKVNLPASLNELTPYSFTDRNEDFTATVEQASYAHQWCIENGVKVEVVYPFTHTDNGDGTATITGLTGTAADLVIPSTIDGLKVTAIGAKAFRFNNEITSVVIPEGVTKIGSGAFNGCRNIQSVSLPSTLVTIESSAFTNCYQIAELAIPAATTDIRSGAFWGSSIALKIDSANTAYKVVDDVLYTADLKTLKFCPINKTGVFAIPAGTEEIEASAFMACNDVTEVQIPASVTAIDGNVFYPMGMLKNFVVDEASQSYQAVDGMLLTKDGKLLIAGCDSLEGTVTIPDGVKEIGLQALMSGDITELVLPEGITTIEMLAVNASELEKVNLPGSLTSIDTDAFSGMRSSLVATVEDGSYAHQWCIDNDVTVEVVYPFTYTDNGDGTCTITGYTGTAAEVSIPAKMDGLTVTVIGMGAFERNETIISVDIPEGVTHIETGVFYLCPNLQSVRLPESLTTIDSAAFGFCSSLTELTIPAAATSIGAAFYGMPTIITVDSANTAYKTVDDVLYTIDGKTLMFCPSTKSGVFSVPEGTETIGYSAFFACEYLTEIRIPASIKTISSTDFYKTSSLTGFVVDENNTAYKAVNGMLLSKDGTQLYTIPQAFSGKVTIPDGVTTICCDALRESQPGITELVLPDSVTTIESIAISHSALEKINLPAGLTSMGYNAINNRSENLVATVEDGSYAHQWCIENGVKVEVTSKPTDPAFFSYTDNGDGSATITGYTGGDSNVVIPSSVYGLQVKAIASNAFANNKTIISVAVPEGVTSIGSYAFMQCSSLESIALPKSLCTIEQFAFAGCSSLKGLFIPEGVTTISWGMLTECSSLESLFLPSTLEEVVTSYAFYKCSSLTAFELAEGNTTFSVVDGVLFNKAGTELVAYPGGKSGHYDIPAGVTLIGDFAFAGVTNPISVTVPVGVTTIEENAFATCSGLKNITLPEGLTSIGNAAFSNCSGLEKISLPSTVELYAGVVFSNCSSMTAYEVASGNSTLSAKDGVLFNKAGTELIAYPGAVGGHYEVPAGVTTLGQSAFSGADKLTSLTIPNGVTTIYANTFRGCSGLEQIDLPQTITALHYSMFEDCTSLKSVVLPDNISTIGNYVFADETTIFCRANTVTAATLTKAGYSYELLSPFTYTDNGDGTAAITGYTGTSAAVTIPASINGLNVTAIADSAFENNTTITSVIIPEGLLTIGEGAFAYCEGLTEIHLPASLTGYESYTFAIHSNIQNITVAEDNPSLQSIDGVLFSIEPQMLVFYPCGRSEASYTVPNGTAIIRPMAFYGANSLQSVVLPEGLKSIADEAFSNCPMLREVNLPASLINIGDYAFDDCEKITASVVADSFAHEWCVSNGMPYMVQENPAESFQYIDNGDGTAAITGYIGSESALVIPDEIGGLKVTSIGNLAFMLNDNITSVVLPEGVTAIGRSAFYGCSQLQSVSLPSTLVKIADTAFSDCYLLEELTIPAATVDIGESFSGSPTKLTIESGNTAYTIVDDVLYTADLKTLKFCPVNKSGAFSIPEGTTALEGAAFESCRLLTEIHIPASVTSIVRGDTFAFTTSLLKYTVDEGNAVYTAIDGMLLSKDGKELIAVPTTMDGSITLPATVQTIKSFAFYVPHDQYGPNEVILPDGAKTIEELAFCNLPLNKIYLPATLKSIDEYAFSNCAAFTATVYENSYAHQWCVDNGVSVEVLEQPFTYTDNGDGTATITGYTGTSADVSIPAKIDGLNVTAIGSCAFEANETITSVVIPEGVTRIRGQAFMNCTNLQQISLPSTLVTIELFALTECPSLTELYIPAATVDIHETSIAVVPAVITVDEANPAYIVVNEMLYTADGKTLKVCPTTKVGALTIPEGTETIEGWAFWGCDSLESIVVPESATDVRQGAFGWCEKLTSITLPQGLTEIPNNMFVACRALSSVEIPAGVTTISDFAFLGTGIADLVLPDGITEFPSNEIDLDTSITFWCNPDTTTEATLKAAGIPFEYITKPVQSMPADQIHPYALPFGIAADVTITDGSFKVVIDDEATDWNDVFTFLEPMPWHNPSTGESGVYPGEVWVTASFSKPEDAVYCRTAMGDTWATDEEALEWLEANVSVQSNPMGWTMKTASADSDTGVVTLTEILGNPETGYDQMCVIQWLDAEKNVLRTEKVVFEITHTNPDKTYNYSRTLIPAENIVANVENASGVTSTVKDGSVSYKQIAEDAVIVTEIIAPENAVTYSAPGEYFDSDAERWPVDNGKIGYVREGTLMDTVTASDFICWYDADGELIGGGWIDFCYERGEEAEILPMAAERIAVQGGAFGLEVDVEITDGMMHAVFDDEATNWNDVFTFLEPTPWYNPETSEKGVRFGAYFYIPEGAAYAKHIVVETEDTDEEILAYLAEETELATLNANMRFGSYYFPAELNNGVITLNDYHTNVQVFQWLDENQNVLFTEKAVLCFEHTNPDKTYNYSRTLIPAQNIVGNAENMPGVTWEASDGLIVTTVEDKQITTTTEIIAPENAATYSMPELDTNGERWPLNNGRVGFQRVGWASTENQTSTEYLLCWYDADGDLIGGGWITMTDVCPIPETVLPAFTKEIAEEAFAGSGVQRVIIPDGCTTIGARAFANCASLTEVHIPASVTSIAEDAFVGCPNLMIYAPMPSTGANFASDHDIKWANVSSFH